MPSPLPPQLAPLADELGAYYRALPGLLAAGHAGRAALVKGGTLVGVWDTEDDAYQAGTERFWPAAFLAQPISPDDLGRLAPYFAAPAAVPA
jgi:hypothetical protein